MNNLFKMTEYLSKFDMEMKDILNYLKSRPEVCDIYIQEILPAVSSALNDWEMRNLCTLPSDLRAFYLTRNGVNIEWKIKLENDTTIPLGKMVINSIHDLTRVGSVLQKDFKEPSLFDIDDIQDRESGQSIPHFDEKTRNFELDSCNGFGKVCLVFTNQNANSDNAEVWFLDRSLQWHFLADSFTNYYRLVVAHLGLPQWQLLFTEDGLPPMLYQWYYLLAPGRILIHEESWRNLVDSKLSKQNFDINKIFKEKDNQKKPNQNQNTKNTSATNTMLNSTISSNKKRNLKN